MPINKSISLSSVLGVKEGGSFGYLLIVNSHPVIVIISLPPLCDAHKIISILIVTRSHSYLLLSSSKASSYLKSWLSFSLTLSKPPSLPCL